MTSEEYIYLVSSFQWVSLSVSNLHSADHLVWVNSSRFLACVVMYDDRLGRSANPWTPDDDNALSSHTNRVSIWTPSQTASFFDVDERSKSLGGEIHPRLGSLHFWWDNWVENVCNNSSSACPFQRIQRITLLHIIMSPFWANITF